MAPLLGLPQRPSLSLSLSVARRLKRPFFRREAQVMLRTRQVSEKEIELTWYEEGWYAAMRRVQEKQKQKPQKKKKRAAQGPNPRSRRGIHRHAFRRQPPNRKPSRPVQPTTLTFTSHIRSNGQTQFWTSTKVSERGILLRATKKNKGRPREEKEREGGKG